MTDFYMATIQPFGFNFAPKNWALAQGQLLSIAQNTALFSLLGTTYGGNGTTNFALPDLRGRVAVGQGQGPGLSDYVMGQQAGTQSTTLLSTNLPAHNHSLVATTVAATATAPSPTEMLAAPNGEDANLGAVTVKMYQPSGGAVTPLSPLSIGPTGGNQPFSIMQPYLCINYSIALQGIFPSRN